MKRLDLVQLTIIVVGLFSGFFFISYIPQLLLYIITWFDEGLSGGYYLQSLIQIIMTMALYFITAMYSIRRSKQLAEWICRNGQLHADVNFALNKTELLFVLFTGLGIYGLIKSLPLLLVNGYSKIKAGNSLNIAEDGKVATASEIMLEVITVLLFFTLVYYAKVFADFFAAKINNTEPEDLIDNPTAD